MAKFNRNIESITACGIRDMNVVIDNITYKPETSFAELYRDALTECENRNLDSMEFTLADADSYEVFTFSVFANGVLEVSTDAWHL